MKAGIRVKRDLTALKHGHICYSNVRYVRRSACALKKPLFTSDLGCSIKCTNIL